MKSPVARVGIVFALLAAATLAVIMYQIVTQQQKVTCEVCITFQGRTDCREAAGPDRSQAIRTATSNACAMISAGMADSISCDNTAPDRVTCSGE